MERRRPRRQRLCRRGVSASATPRGGSLLGVRGAAGPRHRPFGGARRGCPLFYCPFFFFSFCSRGGRLPRGGRAARLPPPAPHRLPAPRLPPPPPAVWPPGPAHAPWRAVCSGWRGGGESATPPPHPPTTNRQDCHRQHATPAPPLPSHGNDCGSDAQTALSVGGGGGWARGVPRRGTPSPPGGTVPIFSTYSTYRTGRVRQGSLHPVGAPRASAVSSRWREWGGGCVPRQGRTTHSV